MSNAAAAATLMEFGTIGGQESVTFSVNQATMHYLNTQYRAARGDGQQALGRVYEYAYDAAGHTMRPECTIYRHRFIMCCTRRHKISRQAAEVGWTQFRSIHA